MNEKEILDLYSSAYNFELSRSDILNSSVNLPIGILTLIIGGVAHFLEKITSSSEVINYLSSSLLIVVMTLTIVFAVIAFYNITKVLLVRKYEYLSNSATIEKYINELNDYNTKVEDELLNVQTEQEIRKLIRKQYIKCTTSNATRNDKKSTHFINALKSLSAAVFFISLSAFSYFYIRLQLISYE